MLKQKINLIPIEVSVLVHNKNSVPCIELRRLIADNKNIKTIVSCAFHGEPFLILPVFKDRIRSLNSLLEKGIIYLDNKDGQYYYNI